MNKFILDIVFKYIFCLMFFTLIGIIFKSLNMNIGKALGMAFGIILFDLIKYIFIKFKNKKTNT